jgi:prefoldin subunit 5
MSDDMAEQIKDLTVKINRAINRGDSAYYQERDNDRAISSLLEVVDYLSSLNDIQQERIAALEASVRALQTQRAA